MGIEVKVEVIHKETIKSSPTPPHLQITKLSVFDQLFPDIYVPLLLFYPTKGSAAEVNINTDHHSLVIERSNILKRSLSETLFYPFVGTFHYNDSIDCNDHGAAFLGAQVNCPLSKLLEKADLRMLNQLLPIDRESKQAVTGYLLLVREFVFSNVVEWHWSQRCT